MAISSQSLAILALSNLKRDFFLSTGGGMRFVKAVFKTLEPVSDMDSFNYIWKQSKQT